MIASIALALGLAGPLDSQQVLERYATRLLNLESAKTLIFSYTVSQAGTHDIEETHRIYRSGELVRDELLASDGETLHPKITRISRYRNHYTLDALAPRLTQYALIFLRAVPHAHHYDYVYKALPLENGGRFTVSGVTIDGSTYLPSVIRFQSTNGTIVGNGAVTFGRSGRYWMPTSATITVEQSAAPARERITFSSYQFPASLPKSTFQAPKPLPAPVLPTF